MFRAAIKKLKSQFRQKVSGPVVRRLRSLILLTRIPAIIRLLRKEAIKNNKILLAAFISTVFSFLICLFFSFLSLRSIDFSQKWMHPTRAIMQVVVFLMMYSAGLQKEYYKAHRAHSRWKNL